MNLLAPSLTRRDINLLDRYVHGAINMLLDARISLFVIYPGLPAYSTVLPFSALQADAGIGNNDPFAGDINFGTIVNETGGKLFFNRNDIDMEIAESEHEGAEYYTLSYQPHEIEPDGKFRHIRVTLRDPNLRAVTKAGYYAPEKDAPLHPRQEALDKLIEAALSTIPFNALDVHLFGVVRHPDTRTAEFTVMLASKVEHVTLEVEPAKLDRVPQVATQFRVAIRVPDKTKSVRVAMESDDGGRIGAAELNRKSIDAAPEAPTAEPQLNPQPAGVQPAVPAKPAPHAAQPDK